MATIDNTIYPPILPTYQKAFVKQSSDKGNKVLFNIQFDVSEYTTITDIRTIEVKIETLNGNTSILAGSNYFVSAQDVINTTTRTGSIDILTSDIDVDVNGQMDLSIGSFYVIQLRTVKEKYEGKNGATDEAKIAQQQFASTYAEEFSEWSTMSLIKCIDDPYLSLMDGQIKMSQINRVSDMSNMIGYLQWANKDASEYLYSYRFRVYDVDDINGKNKKDFDTIFSTITPLEDSGELRPRKASPNRLQYMFKSDFIDNKRYRIYITYETDNKYVKTEYFTFYVQNFISSSNLKAANVNLTAIANNEKQGTDVTLMLDPGYLNVPSKYLVFRRSSSENDFKLWEDIHTVKLTTKNIVSREDLDRDVLQYTWTDWTVRDGIFYKYCVQEVDLIEHRAEKIIATSYEDMDKYYKSLFKCVNSQEEKLAAFNRAENIHFSLTTNVQDNLQKALEEKDEELSVSMTPLNRKRFEWESVLSSNAIALNANEFYKYTCSLSSSKNQKIKINIEGNNIVFLNNSIIELEKDVAQDFTCYFVSSQTQNAYIKYMVESIDETEEDESEGYVSSFNISNISLKKVLDVNYQSDTQKTDLIVKLKDEFFIDKNNTLKISLDSAVSTVTKNRKDTITETLNSKYPFIYRSGKIEYDSYNIEGTISIQGDMYTLFNTTPLIDSWSKNTYRSRLKLHSLDNIFANKKTLLKYDDTYQMYQKYVEKAGLNYQNDFTIERMFREKVEDFLSNGAPKLFRSAEIGNKIVILTDVSFSPKEGTNNMIYTFSATMTELDDDTVENYAFYNIIDLNKWRDELDDNDTNSIKNTIGQYSYYPNKISSGKNDIFKQIKNKYYTETTNFIRTIDNIYKIKIDLSELDTVLTTGSNVLGKATINNKVFYISNNEPYLILSNVNITSFSLEINRNNKNKVIIDYLTDVVTQLKYSTDGWVSTAENHIGQIYKAYYTNENNNIYQDIYSKYYNSNDKFEKKVVAINKLLIQAYLNKKTLQPLSNVNFLIKDKKINIDEDDIAYSHTTDKNGIIDLYDKTGRNINQIILKGVQVKKNTDRSKLTETEYLKIDDTTYPTEQSLFDMVSSPKEHVLYQVSKLNLAFLYNNKQLDYEANIKNKDTMEINISNGQYSTNSVSNAIYQRLNSGVLDLVQAEEDTEKYIYINGSFYKLDKDGYIQIPVYLKVTYLFEYLTKKKVTN